MKQSINFNSFANAFSALRPDNFSYEALALLFDYFEQLEEDTGVEMELDVIAICCDFQESSYEDVISDYNIDTSGSIDLVGTVEEFLQYRTIVVGRTSSGTFVFQQF